MAAHRRSRLSDEDGYFFVDGRSKELIIKGGMNIAPKQIDEVLEIASGGVGGCRRRVPDRYVGEDVGRIRCLAGRR